MFFKDIFKDILKIFLKMQISWIRRNPSAIFSVSQCFNQSLDLPSPALPRALPAVSGTAIFCSLLKVFYSMPRSSLQDKWSESFSFHNKIPLTLWMVQKTLGWFQFHFQKCSIIVASQVPLWGSANPTLQLTSRGSSECLTKYKIRTYLS